MPAMQLGEIMAEKVRAAAYSSTPGTCMIFYTCMITG